MSSRENRGAYNTNAKNADTNDNTKEAPDKCVLPALASRAKEPRFVTRKNRPIEVRVGDHQRAE
jgi:hypothetical protein